MAFRHMFGLVVYGIGSTGRQAAMKYGIPVYGIYVPGSKDGWLDGYKDRKSAQEGYG